MLRRWVGALVITTFIFGMAGPAAAGWQPGLGRAQRYIATRSGTVSFTVINPNGRAFGYLGGRKVQSASVIKVMFMVAYLRKFAPHRKLTDNDRALLAPMIRASDNTAATRIADMLGPGPMYRLAHVAKMKDFSFVQHPWGASIVSARDQARFMFRLHRYIPNRHDRYARYLLSHVIDSQRWGIGRVPKPHWRKYFKGGWGSGTGSLDHQITLLRRGKLKVSAAVMITSSPSHAYATETLQGVFKRLLRSLPKPR